MPRKGQTMLYRPVPQGFVETFVRVGWGGIEREYRAHAKTIRRWMLVCGREGLIAARKEYVQKHGYQTQRRGKRANG